MRSERGNEGPKNSPPRNLLIWSGDARFLEGPAAEWCAAWGDPEGGTRLSAPEISAGDFQVEVRTLPMWSDRQLVRLRQAEQASPELVKALAEYLEKPGDATALLVEYVGDLGPRKASAAWKEILSRIDSRDCSPRGIRAYAVERAREEGLSMDFEAASALEEWACGDMGMAVSAMDLLTLYRQGNRVIRTEDLENLLGAGGTPKVWDLQDAFLKGDRRLFLQLLEGVRRDDETAPLPFLGMLAKQLRAALLFQAFRAQGRAAADIGYRELGFSSAYPAQKLVDSAGRWPEGRIRRSIGALCELDLALKGDPGEPWTILERGLLKLMG